MQLTGRVRDMEAELEAASIFALSSRVEGLPLALLEKAMAKGMAVVSFDRAAGPREVIEHGADGLLVAKTGDVAGAGAGAVRADRVGGAAAAAR